MASEASALLQGTPQVLRPVLPEVVTSNKGYACATSIPQKRAKPHLVYGIHCAARSVDIQQDVVGLT